MSDRLSTRSTYITENKTVVQKIHNAFAEAIGKDNIPTLRTEFEDGDPATTPLLIKNRDRPFTFQSRTITTEEPLAAIYLAYLAPYVPGLTVRSIADVYSELPRATHWHIREDSTTIVKDELGGNQTTFDTEALRSKHATLGFTQLSGFWPDNWDKAQENEGHDAGVVSDHPGQLPAPSVTAVAGYNRDEQRKVDAVAAATRALLDALDGEVGIIQTTATGEPGQWHVEVTYSISIAPDDAGEVMLNNVQQ